MSSAGSLCESTTAVFARPAVIAMCQMCRQRPDVYDDRVSVAQITRRKVADSPAFKAEVVLAALETLGVDARLTELGPAKF